MSKITWLHLSDFHFRKSDSAEEMERGKVFESLLDDVETYPALKDLKIDFVIVTGDIAFAGKEDEYKLAEKFFNRLCEKLNLKKENLLLLPGNHDADRAKIKSSFDLSSLNKINNILGDKEERQFQFKRFVNYEKFLDRFFDGKCQHPFELSWFFTSHYNIDGEKVGIAGLNSAWNSRGDHDERHNLFIGEYQVSEALKQPDLKGCDVTIAAFHHPLDWLRDDEFIATASLIKEKFDFILHGHLHNPGFYSVKDPDIEYQTIPAGACYKKPLHLISCNYVVFDINSRKGKLHLRRYSEKHKEWRPDTETFKNSDNGVCEIDFRWSGNVEKGEQSKSPLRVPEEYRKDLMERCKDMDIKNLISSDKTPLTPILPDLYIPLYTNFAGKKEEEREDSLRDVESKRRENIEELVAEKKNLIVTGQAGSGKSTLFKHIAYNILKGNYRYGFDGWLPVLISLKNIHELAENNSEILSSVDTMLSSYLKGFHLSLPIVKRFCEAGKCVFLVDGLDELPVNEKERILAFFADFGHTHSSALFVFGGRPHSIKSGGLESFKAQKAEILSLEPEEKKEFIKKWYSALYRDRIAKAGKTAMDLTNQVEEIESVRNLTDTPLMLTAICIFYHDARDIPQQRADLYEEFIEHLLKRRLKDEPKASYFLEKLAFHTSEANTEVFNKEFCLDILKKDYMKKADEGDADYLVRLIELFGKIEEGCGIIKEVKGAKKVKGGYDFWHKTFKEFLTARYLAKENLSIDKYLEMEKDGDGNVFKFYIGYLSKEHYGKANSILSDILDRAKAPLYWLLAASSLLEMNPGFWQNVPGKARKRLQEIWSFPEDSIIKAEAGKILGRLGDTRALKTFVEIDGGECDLEKLETKNIDPFAIGKYPVTNQWFREFLKDDGYKDENYWSEEGKRWLEADGAAEPRYWRESRWNCPNSPVVGVCWYEADAFCRWLTLTLKNGHTYRLPTEAEWQVAAAGLTEKRKYPWGEWQENRANTNEAGIGKTSSVGIFLEGATIGEDKDKIFDLSGNVWEWTSSDHETKKKQIDFFYEPDWKKAKELPVLRGGSWIYNSESARCDYRGGYGPYFRDYSVGFRCSRTV